MANYYSTVGMYHNLFYLFKNIQADVSLAITNKVTVVCRITMSFGLACERRIGVTQRERHFQLTQTAPYAKMWDLKDHDMLGKSWGFGLWQEGQVCVWCMRKSGEVGSGCVYAYKQMGM